MDEEMQIELEMVIIIFCTECKGSNEKCLMYYICSFGDVPSCYLLQLQSKLLLILIYC